MPELEFADYVVYGAGAAFFIGYLIINQVALRLCVMVGTALYIWYYAIADEVPLWSAIWTSVAMGLANIFGLFTLWLRASPLSIPKRFRDIYVHFDILPPGDFRKLMKAAVRVTRPEGHVLTTEGERVQTMTYVIDGGVEIHKFGKSSPLPNGIFIGEVAYLTGNRASATTYLSESSDVLEWDVALLKQRSKADVRFRLAMDAMISLDLAGKVARAGAPGEDKDTTKPSFMRGRAEGALECDGAAENVTEISLVGETAT